MTERINLAQDTISRSELSRLSEWLLANNLLTKGPLTKQFEEVFAQYMGSDYAVFVNSGSSANLLIAYALKESGQLANSVAIAPAVSWVTTVAPLMQLGFDTHLCDCDKEDLGVDVGHLEELCRTLKPSVLFLVHVLGHANKMDQVRDICSRFNVAIVEDSCEALGSELASGEKLGSIGRAGSFSFYYGHHISTIEGGMVVTDDRDLYNVMLSIRSHGWSRDIEPHAKVLLNQKYEIDEFRDLYTFYYPGFNLRSTDMQAHLGISQLERVSDIARVRERNFQIYKRELDCFFCQQSDAAFVSSFAYGTLVENRLDVYKHLQANNIDSRPLICGNIGRHPFWLEKHGRVSLPVADRVHDNGIYLPNHANLDENDIVRVCDTFKQVAKPCSL